MIDITPFLSAQDMAECECPEGMWPAKDCGPGAGKCSLSSNQTLPSTIRSCSVPVSRRQMGFDGDFYFGKSTRRKGGECHPSYVFCKETQVPFCLMHVRFNITLPSRPENVLLLLSMKTTVAY